MVRRTRSLRSGASLIDSLAGTLILTVGIMGLISMAAVVYQLTTRTDENGLAYSLARRTIEEARAQGFFSAAEGSVSTFVDRHGGNPSSTSFTDATYQINRTITSSEFQIGANGSVAPSPQALRTIDVRVVRIHPNAELLRIGSILVRGGL